MSEVTITIPLSLLDGAENLTPQGIQAALAKVGEDRGIRDRYESVLQTLRAYGANLQSLLDADMILTNKFNQLRQMASELQQLGRALSAE